MGLAGKVAYRAGLCALLGLSVLAPGIPRPATATHADGAGESSKPRASAAVAAEEAQRLKKAGRQAASALLTVYALTAGVDGPRFHRGTGVLVTQGGYVFTPLALVRGADALYVSFSHGKRAPAQVLATDERNHVAVLRIPNMPAGIDGVALAPPCEERAGQAVGLLTWKRGEVALATGRLSSANVETGPLGRALEARVADSPGPWGGVLINSRGELLGLAVAVGDRDRQETSTPVYALPASRIRRGVDRILLGSTGTQIQSESELRLTSG